MNIKSALLILASTALALPTPPALPNPHTQPSPPTKAKVGIWSNYADSWNECGLRRRRVEFASLGTPAEIFCEWWVDRKDRICEFSNKQCFWDARVETWAAETSWVAGPLGKHQFEKCFEKGMGWWKQKAALHYWEMDTGEWPKLESWSTADHGL